MYAVNQISINALSSFRAFVTAESSYSKSQKDAAYFLSRYATTHAITDYQSFIKAISIPLADAEARLALQQTPPDIPLAKEYLIKAKIHPNDAEGIINSFLRFSNNSLLQLPIKIWSAADVNVKKLKITGEELHHHVKAGNINSNIILSLVDRINVLNSELSIQEDTFSNALGKTSRNLHRYVDIFEFSITIFLVLLGVVLTRRIIIHNVVANYKLRENESRLNSVLTTAMDAVVQIKSDGTITGWSGQAENIFGWSSSEAIGQLLHNLIVPTQHVQAHLMGMRHFMATGEGPVMNKRIEITAIRRDGFEFPIELTISLQKWGNETEFSAFIRDITERKKSAEQLFNLAHYDGVTDLPNRLLFHDRLDQEIKKTKRTNSKLAVMLLDLDHFKEVNDTLGHDNGDALLKKVAQRLKTCIRDIDILARLGGDEFTLILPFNDDLHIVESVAQRILNSLAEPFNLEANPVYISASIGVTVFPQDGQCIKVLLKNADQAMYAAKNKGRNRYNYFISSMQEHANARASLAKDLRLAVLKQQFVLVYQPIIDLKNSKIHKAEALIRWIHPEKGIISPLEFIPIAEQTGLIVEIGEWVFQESARQVKKWRQSYHPAFQISVNKSPVQFYDRASKHLSWGDQLMEVGLPRDSIVVEITEGLLLEASDHVTKQLADLRSDGFKIAIDDFGTGYSSLSYLRKFEIDYLKIDQSFVNQLKVNSSDLALCEAIIVMAHKLGIKVIAEGVETVEQCDLLTAAGCDFAQGYYFSKPVLPEEFESLVLLPNRDYS